MILNPKSVLGHKTAPGVNEKSDLIKISGPGVFISAFITKQGGSNDHAHINIFIDGVIIFSMNYASAESFGFDEQNNSGIKLVKGNVDCLSIQYCQPLFFEKDFRIELDTASDSSILVVRATALLGSGCKYPA